MHATWTFSKALLSWLLLPTVLIEQKSTVWFVQLGTAALPRANQLLKWLAATNTTVRSVARLNESARLLARSLQSVPPEPSEPRSDWPESASCLASSVVFAFFFEAFHGFAKLRGAVGHNRNSSNRLTGQTGKLDQFLIGIDKYSKVINQDYSLFFRLGDLF